MYTEFEIRQLPLSLKNVREKVTNFLKNNDLKLEDIDFYFGVFALDGSEILAGGGYKDNLIKCIAVDSRYRENALSNRLISHLISSIMAEGYANVKVFTKPSNADIFESFGFKTIARSRSAILMDNNPTGISSYTEYLSAFQRSGNNGAIVMNANPFTKGHRHLIEQASKIVDNLYVISVKEDKSLFSYPQRYEMIQRGCRDLKNVMVCHGSEYVISSATFPTYFIKEVTDATEAQIELDLSLFTEYIAPALNITTRFIGSEPQDLLTRQYNRKMKELLPQNNIKVIEVERIKLKEEGEVISASSLRRELENNNFEGAAKFAYSTTVPYLISYLATRALRLELETTPKPGLVDKADSGAHRDMNYKMMNECIEIMRSYTDKFSLLGYTSQIPDIEEIIKTGEEAQNALLEHTKGINTYKGALLCLGLGVISASLSYCKEEKIESKVWREFIIKLAKHLPEGKGTHAQKVKEKYKISSALDNARAGYPLLFEKWIPFYCNNIKDEHCLLKTILLIMSTLEDTNVYYRGGEKGAEMVKKSAEEVLNDFSVEKVKELNKFFINENISPGGCADMLSLTIFAFSILSDVKNC